MYRSCWELDVLNRRRIAALIDERQANSRAAQADRGPAFPFRHLRQRLGIGLIRAGRALAGQDAARGLSMPPARSAPWGQSGA